MIEAAIALLLLTGPAEPAAGELVNASFLAGHLQHAGLALEIFDARETRFVFVRPEDFVADVKLLRRRWVELRDAPPLHDCARFPDRAQIDDRLTFNRQYRQHLTNLMELRPRDAADVWTLREAIVETDQLYTIWDIARDARSDFYYLTVRRQALKNLRETIGFEAFCNGCLPPHVPLWRFTRLDR